MRFHPPLWEYISKTKGRPLAAQTLFLRLECGTDGIRAAGGASGTNVDLLCGAVAALFVIFAVFYAAVYSVYMLTIAFTVHFQQLLFILLPAAATVCCCRAILLSAADTHFIT